LFDAGCMFIPVWLGRTFVRFWSTPLSIFDLKFCNSEVNPELSETADNCFAP